MNRTPYSPLSALHSHCVILVPILILLLGWTGLAQAEMAHYWQKFPHPKTIYVTCGIGEMPAVSGTPRERGSSSLLNFTIQSLADLNGRLKAYRQWLAKADLATPVQCREAFEKLRQARDGRE